MLELRRPKYRKGQVWGYAADKASKLNETDLVACMSAMKANELSLYQVQCLVVRLRSRGLEGVRVERLERSKGRRHFVVPWDHTGLTLGRAHLLPVNVLDTSDDAPTTASMPVVTLRLENRLEK